MESLIVAAFFLVSEAVTALVLEEIMLENIAPFCDLEGSSDLSLYDDLSDSEPSDSSRRFKAA